VLLHYLVKQKAENCVFSLKRWELFCQQTHKTFILSLGHSWTALHSHKNQPHVPSQTDEARIARYHLLPHTHRLPSLSWCRSLCPKWELFLVEPQVKSQRTVLIGYLTISTNVTCYQARCRQQYYLFAFQEHSLCMHQCMVCSTLFNSYCAKLSTSFLLSYSPPTGQSWTQLMTRFRKSIPARIWVSRQQNWRNQAAAGWTLEMPDIWV